MSSDFKTVIVADLWQKIMDLQTGQPVIMAGLFPGMIGVFPVFESEEAASIYVAVAGVVGSGIAAHVLKDPETDPEIPLPSGREGNAKNN